MYKHLTLLALLFVPQIILAYNPILNSTTIPYEPMVIDGRIEEEVQYLGHLVGDPHMYEFTIGAEMPLALKVTQLETSSPVLFSLIAVKENTHNAGVTEVGRLPARPEQLVTYTDTVLGMTLMESQFFNATLTPGTYRVEVSTPDNFGKYMLTIGTRTADVGYFETLGDIRTIQKFFDKSLFALLASSHIKYPLGSILLLVLIYVTWRKRAAIERFRHG